MNNIKKAIRISLHAAEQCKERGATEEDVVKAIKECIWISAKKNRSECKITLPFHAAWNGHFYIHKEVRPIFVEEENEIVVITVYVYYN